MKYPNPAFSVSQLESPRERLLKFINDESDLPTLGVAIAKVVEITSSGEDSVARLAHFILSDVGLTQKILRLSNTVQYRTSAGAAVTTISRAIFLLGFNTVKDSALAMLLVDCFKDMAQVSSVRKELVRSLCASMIGREMAQRGRFQDSEEAAVASLFKNVGRVLVASFDHDLYMRIQHITETADSRPEEAATVLLGCSFERFGEMALQSWKIPDTIIQSLTPLPVGELRKPVLRHDWLKQVASFSDTLAGITMSAHADRKEQYENLLRRFGNVLELDRNILGEIIQKVEEETRQLAKSMDLSLHDLAGVPAEQAPLLEVPLEFLLQTNDVVPAQQAARYASGKPVNARDLLLAGVQDVTQMLAAEDYRLNDLILLVLETLYTSLGFRFATICLRDRSSERFVSRVAVGEQYAERQRGFHFPVKGEADLFQLSLSNNADVMIAELRAPKIRHLLPAWYLQLLPDARSCIILPLVIQKKPIGLFYADRINTAEEGVPQDETALIKTLKNQLLAAIMRG
ncbi:HDOD domain-containing protein [Undibacterium oligocarboniphilum]|uniref:HDOD domain-containing protein n=1 Tax=Undibacterium oligocarboniphilum TaxID=666702 RepID=A0A850QPK8_9BURK|nr:HDOD domain-containing protein [Undibacterium oligocarboniphilum]MBC3869637.1 HDOD domain-containing protein [Undibacterium oligocarboniphilum]NVO78016.1 HDOD domain-containing protein [Undibacterium oligocarboniphilum]